MCVLIAEGLLQNGLGSFKLPSDIPPLEDMLSDSPAVEARQVPAPADGTAAPDTPNRLVGLPSLHSNPTLSLSFSRFMAALDEDLRALGAPNGGGAADAPAAAAAAAADAAPAVPAPENPRQPPAAAPPATSCPPAPKLDENARERMHPAAAPTHKPPSPALSAPAPPSRVASAPLSPMSTQVNHCVTDASRAGDGGAGACDGNMDSHSAPAPAPAPHPARTVRVARTPVKLMNIPKDDTDQLELLLADKPASSLPDPHAALHHGSSDVDHGMLSGSHGMVSERATVFAPLRSAGGAPSSPHVRAPAGRLPRRESVEEAAPAWMSPRSVTTVSAPQRPTPEGGWMSPHLPRGAAQGRTMPWGSEPLQRRSSVEVDPAEGVSQAEVHAWINECYVSSGLTRPLSCLDYQV